MSSPNIKFQSLIRKYKNGVKETIDKKKIITDYTHQIICDDILDNMFLFNSKNKDEYTYNLNEFIDIKMNTIKQKTKNISINMPSPTDNFLFSYSPDFMGGFPTIQEDNKNILEYIDAPGEGLLKNVYNAELCTIEWVIFMYFINRLYPNFASHDKIKIKSIHIHAAPSYELSAMHHFLYNSKLYTLIPNIEWEWVGTFKNNDTKLERKYRNNLIHLFNSEISSQDNAQFVINTILEKQPKSNFMCLEFSNNLRDLLYYGILAIKLLENNCLFYLQLPAIDAWDEKILNAVILYSLIFQEVYIFKFDIEKKFSVIICKNKKKALQDFSKKLLHILMNKDFSKEYNIFSRKFLEKSAVSKKIRDIINSELYDNNTINPIVFNDIVYEMMKVLEYNNDTFL